MLRSVIKILLGSLALLVIMLLSVVLRNSSARTFWANSAITSLIWSPDGQTLAIGSADGTILLWDIAMDKPRHAIDVHSSVVSLAWSPDSRMIASGMWSETDQSTITLWDSVSGERLQTIGVPAPKLRAVSWSPDGLSLSAGFQDNRILFWDLNTDDVQHVDSLSDEVLNLAFSPDGHLLAVGQQDGFVTFVDSSNHEAVRKVSISPDYYVADIAWSPDGQALASAACSPWADLRAECALILWNPSHDEYIQSFQGGEYDFTSVAWSPSGRFIASAFLNGDVTLYNPGSGRRIRTMKTPVGTTIVAWAPDDQTLAAGSEDGSVLLWTIH